MPRIDLTKAAKPHSGLAELERLISAGHRVRDEPPIEHVCEHGHDDEHDQKQSDSQRDDERLFGNRDHRKVLRRVTLLVPLALIQRNR
jgi:hypothetical protein